MIATYAGIAATWTKGMSRAEKLQPPPPPPSAERYRILQFGVFHTQSTRSRGNCSYHHLHSRGHVFEDKAGGSNNQGRGHVLGAFGVGVLNQ